MPLGGVVDTELLGGTELGCGFTMGEFERLAGPLERNHRNIEGRRAGCARNRGQQQHQARRNDRQESAQELARLKHLIGSLGTGRQPLELPPQRPDCKGATVDAL